MSEQNKGRWFGMDLHIHTPASTDYGQETSWFDILRQARKSLQIIGLVDHNTVRGYEQLRLELSRLTVLHEASLLSEEEGATWQEYKDLLSGFLVLPGFELTSQEGIHLLALFPPKSSAERLYALLLNLGIPMDQLREGSPDIRAQADVQMTCTLVAQAGGIAIAAHADAAQGLGMTLEAFPQGLLALEVTAIPEGSPEGPLPLLWFSNAHSLQDRQGERHWGIGEQYTEVFLEHCSFDALRDLLRRGEQQHLRFPEQIRLRAYLEGLRRENPERLILHGPEIDPSQVYQDVVALSNAGGGIIMIGLTEEEIVGIAEPESWSSTLLRQAREKVDPPPHLTLELLCYEDKEIIRVEVRADLAPPYLSAEGIVYVRQQNETRPANRQELLDLISTGRPAGLATSAGLDLPQAGVEIVGAHLRDGTWFYDIRDLRVTSGVTRQRAKGLWAYAIERHESLRQGRADLSKVVWEGNRGLWRSYYSGERRVFDLVHRDSNGRVDHLFYGVSEWGLVPGWRNLVESMHIGSVEQSPPPPREREDVQKDRLETQPQLRPAEPEAELPATTATPAVAETSATAGAAAAAAAADTVVVATAPPATQTPDVPTSPQDDDALEKKPPQVDAPIRSSPDDWGGRLLRWRIDAAVERIYWDGNKLFFDLAMRQQEDGQVRYFRRIHPDQLTDGWVELIHVPRPTTGVEVVRSTTSGDEILYQFRDMETGRIDPRVRRASEFSPDSPYAYAIRMFHENRSLDNSQVRWCGNIGYMRPTAERVDLIYRDEAGRDLIYYTVERRSLTGEWQDLLLAWDEKE